MNKHMKTTVHYRSIGVIRTPFKEIQGMPIQPTGAHGILGTVEVFPDYAPGLKDLNGFSHIYVYWWFDRNDTPQKRAILQIHPSPPGNTKHPLTGVFATRSPFRPNLIAMTLCKILSVKDNVVQVEGIDAYADTPVLDIKPYVPRFDSTSNATIPWWLKRKQPTAKTNTELRSSDGQ